VDRVGTEADDQADAVADLGCRAWYRHMSGSAS
jgi:hypothetical protein